MTYIYQKQPNDLYLDLQERMKAAGVTNSYPDALANIINEFITEELFDLSNEFNNKISEYSLSTATGEALDRLVSETYGFTRFAASKAFNIEGLKIENFSAEDIVIPAGTMFSGGETFSDEGIVYETIDEITLEGDGTEFISVIAVEPGSFYNVDADYLTNNNLNSDIVSTLLYPIVNGADRETDDAFRTRALLYMTALTSNNLDYLKLKLLEVPGVLNIRYIQGYNGLGTLAVFATTAGNKSSAELKQIINGRLLELRTPGSAITYEEGIRTIFDIKIAVLNTRNYSEEEVNQIKFEIRRFISQELVRSKREGVVDFTNIQNNTLAELRDVYSFSNSNENNSIFESIKVRNIDPNSTDNVSRPNTTLSLTGSRITYSLKEEEVPELGDVNIEVRLIL